MSRMDRTVTTAWRPHRMWVKVCDRRAADRDAGAAGWRAGALERRVDAGYRKAVARIRPSGPRTGSDGSDVRGAHAGVPSGRVRCAGNLDGATGSPAPRLCGFRTARDTGLRVTGAWPEVQPVFRQPGSATNSWYRASMGCVTLHAIRSRRVPPAGGRVTRRQHVTHARQEAQMPAGSVSSVAEPHPSRPLGLLSHESPSVSLAGDSLPAGASMAGTGVDCARCGGRGGVYIPSLLRELSCPECG